MRVLVTGSRDFTDEAVIHAALDAEYDAWLPTPSRCAGRSEAAMPSRRVTRRTGIYWGLTPVTSATRLVLRSVGL